MLFLSEQLTDSALLFMLLVQYNVKNYYGGQRTYAIAMVSG
jgi:hypothetical protein